MQAAIIALVVIVCFLACVCVFAIGMLLHKGFWARQERPPPRGEFTAVVATPRPPDREISSTPQTTAKITVEANAPVITEPETCTRAIQTPEPEYLHSLQSSPGPYPYLSYTHPGGTWLVPQAIFPSAKARVPEPKVEDFSVVTQVAQIIAQQVATEVRSQLETSPSRASHSSRARTNRSSQNTPKRSVVIAPEP
eukprot:TRINITY_DN4418_c0_g1_i1.p1 TRINITY_DN4418_c0_g1~~TRINITY_DN4418_c0_g1_i1.p1  ORF type:complete len:195 (-),score=16.22 TRINITY_DN4418_c0_g1_i1:36-620(-)